LSCNATSQESGGRLRTAGSANVSQGYIGAAPFI
jgi:hypothetical protein